MGTHSSREFMTFKEVLQQPVKEITSNDDDIEGYLSVQLDSFVEFPLEFNSNQEIKIHILEDFCYDGRRVWQLFYVTFMDRLVMLCYAAGREGQDSYNSKIFDVDRLIAMLIFINSKKDFYGDENRKKYDAIKINQSILLKKIEPTKLNEKADDFVNFYSNKINDVFSSW